MRAGLGGDDSESMAWMARAPVSPSIAVINATTSPVAASRPNNRPATHDDRPSREYRVVRERRSLPRVVVSGPVARGSTWRQLVGGRSPFAGSKRPVGSRAIDCVRNSYSFVNGAFYVRTSANLCCTRISLRQLSSISIWLPHKEWSVVRLKSS
jgi:hypothetical protein